MSMIGKTLIHYEITSEIGKGGMGEVYQAKDTKLGRDVAIKVLPEEFALDKDRVARFQREAKLLASLNHPNIAAIYGLEESEGTHFLVMELIEGDTLRDRIKSGPIPVEEALKLALQTAEALEVAHENGVIHRDLKPANIKVTPDGKVKILDFGLAKAYAGDQENINLADSPTISAAATQQGVILGTAAYMSPEQARGKPVDRRADIWAFGVVLYEMLTGKSLFSGEDVTSTVARVLEREPDFSTLPKNLHPRIQLMFERCLKKDPKTRYHDIADVRVDIQEVLADPSGVFAQPVPFVERRAGMRTILSWIAVVILVGIVVGASVWYFKAPEPSQLIQFEYELPVDQQIVNSPSKDIGVSHDGKQIVYCTSEGLYLRSIDNLNAKHIAGSDRRVIEPTFSPDGKSIAYFSQGDLQLKKIAVEGGVSVPLYDFSSIGSISWDEDGSIVFSSIQTGIMRISSKGGPPETLVEPKSEQLFNPQILPDGKSLLYTIGPDQPRVMVQSINSGEPKELFTGWFRRYLPSGHIVYWEGGNLYTVQFDSDSLEAVGEHILIVSGVDDAAVSDSGTLIYTPLLLHEGPKYTLVWVGRDGNKEEPLGTQPNTYGQPKISPDGKQIAITIGGFFYEDIYIWDITRKTPMKLTFDEMRALQSVWTPDSKRIIYAATFEDNHEVGIYCRAADGSGEIEKLLSESGRSFLPYSISRDGKTLLIMELVSLENGDICMLSMEGDRKVKPLFQKEYSEGQPTISPDGRWLAYSSNELSGVMFEDEVYIRPFPDVNEGRKQVSNNGGSSPIWSSDGKELFYLSRDNSAMVVSVKTEPVLSLGPPEVLFKSDYCGLTNSSGTPWDIHPDGEQFLMMKEYTDGSAGATFRSKIIVVLNWFEELKERVPVD